MLTLDTLNVMLAVSEEGLIEEVVITLLASPQLAAFFEKFPKLKKAMTDDLPRWRDNLRQRFKETEVHPELTEEVACYQQCQRLSTSQFIVQLPQTLAVLDNVHSPFASQARALVTDNATFTPALHTLFLQRWRLSLVVQATTLNQQLLDEEREQLLSEVQERMTLSGQLEQVLVENENAAGRLWDMSAGQLKRGDYQLIVKYGDFLAQQPETLKVQTYATPHPGEAAKLLGISTQDVEADRVQAVQQLQRKYAGQWVLKGAGSLILEDRLWICTAGNAGMGTGGMGDVLAGIAAHSAQERIAAKHVLSELTLGDLRNHPVIPYEEDCVTRVIQDAVNESAYARIKGWTVSELREWVLSDETSQEELEFVRKGLTSEMVAAVAKICSNGDLMYGGKKMPVISAGKIEFLYPDNADLLAYRRYDGETELLVLCNLRERKIAKPLPVGWTDAEKLLGNYPDTADTLRPYECVVLKK